MKLRDVTNASTKEVPKDEQPQYLPSFIKGDKVKLIPAHKNYSPDLHKIVNMELTVLQCKLSNLGDMEIEVIYLDESVNIKASPGITAITYVKNPYFAEHFKKVNGETNTNN